MRRISTGVQGRPILGKYFSVDNVLSTLETNTDIRLEPSGSGKVISDADLTVSSGNRLEIVSSGSSNSVNLVAPSGLGSDLTLTLPSNNGSAGDVLTVDGAGNLSFTDLTIEVSNQSADTSTYYPLLSTSTSGSINSVDVSSSKLSFQPSSGSLSVTDISATSGTFSNNLTVSNDLTVTNDLSAGTITETSSIVLKENISPLKNAVVKILQLDAVNYNRISSGKKEVGFIAEDVETIIPEVVDINGEYKSISYSRLTAYLVEAVKELKTQINELENGRVK